MVARSVLLSQHAACMRHAPTASEAALWARLSGSQLGVAFRRQVVIGNYVADFAAPRVRLVVEVDGGCHAGRERLDAKRDARLALAGWRVVRVGSDVAVEEMVGVIVAALRGYRLVRRHTLSSIERHVAAYVEWYDAHRPHRAAWVRSDRYGRVWGGGRGIGRRT